MNHDALIQRGRLPWEPNEDTTKVEAWHVDDVPTVGLLWIKTSPVLFTTIGELSAGLSVWAYVCTSPSEAAKIEDLTFPSIEAMQEFVDEAFKGRTVVFALAQDLELRRWNVQEEVEDLYSGANTFLRQVVEALEAERSPRQRFQATKSELEALAPPPDLPALASF